MNVLIGNLLQNQTLKISQSLECSVKSIFGRKRVLSTNKNHIKLQKKIINDWNNGEFVSLLI